MNNMLVSVLLASRSHGGNMAKPRSLQYRQWIALQERNPELRVLKWAARIPALCFEGKSLSLSAQAVCCTILKSEPGIKGKSVPVYKININVKVFVSHSVGSSLTLWDPHGLQPASQAPLPWISIGKNTGVGSHSFLQAMIFLTQELNPGLLHCSQILKPSEPPGKP